ncbi:MAG: glycosyltransferase family 2 protein [Myxococcales bacterium]|nr:glycosyltransferase family 2 protein [Myxococcales bacterium]
MYEGKTVAVVVPCYNEQTQIGTVLETMPDFVDRVLVVDDQSRDDTVATVQRYVQERDRAGRIELIEHRQNQGVGRAITTGYERARELEIDITAVMAGDGQMAPAELELLVEQVAHGAADYAKGNRLFYNNAWGTIPKHRFLGNAFLSMLTKVASGYWHSVDSQTGYTAISLEALRLLDLDGLYPRYGYPNDMLVHLNVWNMRVVDVPIEPVYNVGEQSKMKIWKVVPTISWLIFKGFLWRMGHKYIIHNFHPLVLFYATGALSSFGGSLLGLYLLVHRFTQGTPVATTSALFSAFLVMSGLQLLLFGMWFDMEDNRMLRVLYRRIAPERRGHSQGLAASASPDETLRLAAAGGERGPSSSSRPFGTDD